MVSWHNCRFLPPFRTTGDRKALVNCLNSEAIGFFIYLLPNNFPNLKGSVKISAMSDVMLLEKTVLRNYSGPDIEPC